MHDTITKTSTLLLTGLHDPKNHAVWTEFDMRYRPILFGMVRKQGLSHADAEDVVQQSLAAFSHDYLAGLYDRQRGQLRAWLFGIVRHRIVDQLRSSARQPEHESGTAMQRVPDDAMLKSSWDTERALVILQVALERLRASGSFASQAIDVFESVGLRGQTARGTAARYSIRVEDVYAAKYRVGKALQDQVLLLEKAYDL